VIVAIDLDEFKQVNDVYSHTTGDRVLIAVARAVSERVRLEELVARRGGDEFTVVINDADPEYADAVVQRIADAIAQVALAMDGGCCTSPLRKPARRSL
jgi:diguanylate cyclase (GGDEF)-like protein